MKKILLLLLLLLLPILFIVLGFFINDLICLPNSCIIFSFPLFEIIILLLNIFVIWKIFSKIGYKAIVLLILVPIYILLQFLTFQLSREFFGYFWLQKSEKLLSTREREQHGEKVKIGLISIGSNFIDYECKICGYGINFPKDWGYEEMPYSPAPIDLSEFHILTSNYAYSPKSFSGQRFWIMSTAGDPFNLFQNEIRTGTLRPETLSVGKEKIVAKVYERHNVGVIPPNEWYVVFDSQDKKRHFGIKVDYQNEPEMINNLDILLGGFQFL